MPKALPPTSLSVLAKGNLPKRVLNSIEDIELSVEEVTNWEQSRSPFRLTVTDNMLSVELSWRVSLVKVIGFGVGLISGIGVIIKILMPHIPQLLAIVASP